MAHWLERSPPTNVARVQFRPSAICGVRLLSVLTLLRGFSRGSRFSSPAKTNNLNRIGNSHENHLAAKADVASSLNIVIYFSYLRLRSRGHLCPRSLYILSDVLVCSIMRCIFYELCRILTSP